MGRALAAIFCFVLSFAAAGAGTTGPLLWTVHGAQGTAYLLGSIHALPKNLDWQTPRLREAIAAADTFVFEVPMDEDSRLKAADFMRRNALFPMSESLPSFFDDRMRSQYRQVILLTHADPTYIVYMRPWLAALVLQGVADGGTGFIAAEGVDNKIYAEAKARKGVHFRALETDAVQFRLLMGDGKLDDELALLRQTFDEILKRRGPAMKDVVGAWMKGDVKALIACGPGDPELTPKARKALLDDRNGAWIPELVAMLNEKHTYFVTVGIAHLVGPGGVPARLRAAGLAVEGP